MSCSGTECLYYDRRRRGLKTPPCETSTSYAPIYCRRRTRIENARFALVAGDDESMTRIVKFHVPVCAGTPAIIPVEAFTLRPGGSDPLETDHLNGVLPPEVEIATE